LALAVRLDDGLRFTSTTYVQPRFDAPEDYRLLDESAFEANLGKRLTAKVSIVVRYDSEPPTGVHPTDVDVRNSLGATF
jgi:putative salt-induced outer membrane protein YdiY